MNQKIAQWLAFVAAMFGSFQMPSADATPQATAFTRGETVVLPPYLVAEDVPWRYISTSGLEVISRCSDRDTREFVETFILRDKELQEMFPENLRFKPSGQVIIILITGQMASAMGTQLKIVLAEQPRLSMRNMGRSRCRWRIASVARFGRLISNPRCSPAPKRAQQPKRSTTSGSVCEMC